jgi:Tol biopolymer transport system component
MTFKRFFVVFIIAAVCLAAQTALGGRINPSLKWKTISTEHFDVHYHEGAEWTAEQVAQIAEEIYPHITGLYNYEPKRVNFVIKDTEDYANGAAYFYDDKVEIWATNLEFGMRGTTEWLRNVVTHEYTHIVSIQAGMKMPLRIPALYFQAISFEEEKRPDVLTGYPNAIVSYPFVGSVMPPWYAEGAGQYQSPAKKTDCWDTHRDMILRVGVLNDKMLSYDRMGYLGHGSLGNEQVYDHGYGLVRYIALTYGPESIEHITREMGSFSRMSMDGALEKVTGKDGKELYADWQDYLRLRYEGQERVVRANPREGRILNDDGNFTVMPTFSPDGKRVAFLSNKGSEYSRLTLYLVDRDGKNLTRIKAGVTSRPVFSADGKKVLYGRHRIVDKYNTMQSDLHVYDIDEDEEIRLTKKQRASQPNFSPDGRKIVCVLNSDGTHRLAVMDADGSNVRIVYEREKGTQFYAPQYSPDGKKILFGIFNGGTRDIATIDRDGSNFEYLIRTENDERDARWLPDGSGIVFASDRTGIFNVYKTTLGRGRFEQLTNVLGGAFTPDVSVTDGSLVYAGFGDKGYSVLLIDGYSTAVAQLDERAYAERTMGELDECVALKNRRGVPTDAGVNSSGDGATADRTASASVDGVNAGATIVPASMAGAMSGEAGAQESVAGARQEEAANQTTGPGDNVGASAGQFEKKDYEWTYSNLQFFPRVVIWDGTPRFGAFIGGSEILDKQFFFLGGSYGIDGRFDAFIDFELRHLFPVIYMQFIRMREITSEYSELENDPDFDAINLSEIRYDLWAADMGLRFEFQDPFNLIQQHDFAVWYSHSEYRVHIDWEGIRDGVAEPQYPAAWKYYIGNDIYARWHFKSVNPATDSNINPRSGRQWTLQYMHGMDELFDSGEFEYGFKSKLTEYNYNQYTFDLREYVPMPWWRHSLEVRAYGSFIDREVDDFFWVYMGGMDYLRGYTYYSIGGQKGWLLSGTYRFPILRNIGRQFSWLTIKDVYGGVFYEAARAWRNQLGEDQNPDDDMKTAVGLELRMMLGSYYSYPTAVEFVAARSLDQSVFYLPSFEHATIHEPQWRYYLSIGFFF